MDIWVLEWLFLVPLRKYFLGWLCNEHWLWVCYRVWSLIDWICLTNWSCRVLIRFIDWLCQDSLTLLDNKFAWMENLFKIRILLVLVRIVNIVLLISFEQDPTAWCMSRILIDCSFNFDFHHLLIGTRLLLEFSLSFDFLILLKLHLIFLRIQMFF